MLVCNDGQHTSGQGDTTDKNFEHKGFGLYIHCFGTLPISLVIDMEKIVPQGISQIEGDFGVIVYL